MSALNKRVTLQRRTGGQDATGAPLPEDWVNVVATGDGKVWAGKTDMSGRQYISARATQNAVVTKFRIRTRAGVVPAMRLLHGADIYDIEAVLEDGQWLDLMCARKG